MSSGTFTSLTNCAWLHGIGVAVGTEVADGKGVFVGSACVGASVGTLVFVAGTLVQVGRGVGGRVAVDWAICVINAEAVSAAWV